MNDSAPRSMLATVDAAIAHAAHPHVILIPGDRWQHKAVGPWARVKPHRVTILASTEAWVRFDRGVEGYHDERLSRATFLENYELAPPEDVQTEDEQLRARFERWARSMGWNVEREGDGYRYDSIHYGWHAYQAGARGLGV
jgi:hypothetical protein